MLAQSSKARAGSFVTPSGTTTFVNAVFISEITFSKDSLNPICFVFLFISKILNLSFGISLCFLLFI